MSNRPLPPRRLQTLRAPTGPALRPSTTLNTRPGRPPFTESNERRMKYPVSNIKNLLKKLRLKKGLPAINTPNINHLHANHARVSKQLYNQPTQKTTAPTKKINNAYYYIRQLFGNKINWLHANNKETTEILKSGLEVIKILVKEIDVMTDRLRKSEFTNNLNIRNIESYYSFNMLPKNEKMLNQLFTNYKKSIVIAIRAGEINRKNIINNFNVSKYDVGKFYLMAYLYYYFRNRVFWFSTFRGKFLKRPDNNEIYRMVSERKKELFEYIREKTVEKPKPTPADLEKLKSNIENQKPNLKALGELKYPEFPRTNYRYNRTLGTNTPASNHNLNSFLHFSALYRGSGPL